MIVVATGHFPKDIKNVIIPNFIIECLVIFVGSCCQYMAARLDATVKKDREVQANDLKGSGHFGPAPILET